jgi:hypothetical protein
MSLTHAQVESRKMLTCKPNALNHVSTISNLFNSKLEKAKMPHRYKVVTRGNTVIVSKTAPNTMDTVVACGTASEILPQFTASFLESVNLRTFDSRRTK